MPGGALHQRMGDETRHRGPDDDGSYVGKGVLLGMRRLSVIDVEGGQQPIANEDQSVWAVCNGEIYNFRELRAQLEQRGHLFKTRSDSEVIVHLYEDYGQQFVEYLDGMFGFALWDVKRECLLVGRDRLGIKPLYYLIDDSRLIFASEAKAILRAPGVKPEVDPNALSEYLSLGYVPGPLSMFRGIRKLPPASLMTCKSGRCDIHIYWRPSTDVDHDLQEADWARLVLDQLEKSVVSQMVSDVPLGAFLSGGIDSSAVVALMARNSDQKVKTYSIGFGDSSGGGYYNELPFAKLIAEKFDTDHQEILVQPDVATLLPKLIWHMDEPVADAAFVTTYLVSEFAKKSVTVILSGVGGDELFGGYRRYLGGYYGRQYARLPLWFRRSVLSPIARRLPSDRHSPLMNFSRYARSFILSNELSFEDRYRSYIQVFGRREREALLHATMDGADDAITRAFGRAQGDSLSRLTGVDMATQLPDDLLMLTDKMSMATSLECRVPFLDHQLVELASRMPEHVKIRGRELKHILKVALAGVLPRQILYRSKRGFGAPMGAWFKGELATVLKSFLSREVIEGRGLFEWEAVSETMRLHESNRADHTDHLMALLNFEIWARIFLDGESPSDLSDQIRAEAGR